VAGRKKKKTGKKASLGEEERIGGGEVLKEVRVRKRLCLDQLVALRGGAGTEQ